MAAMLGPRAVPEDAVNTAYMAQRSAPEHTGTGEQRVISQPLAHTSIIMLFYQEEDDNLDTLRL